ncbi:phage tail tube protein, partial [Klebsiella pneumoniae]
GSATIPTTLKDSKGADITVTSVVTDSTGTTQSDLTKLKAGNYNVVFSASGYNDLNTTFTITHK